MSGRPLCKVFLSHNSKDKQLVKEIAERLELDFGVAHFLDAFAIPSGEAFRPWIERTLQESSGCAIFLGANGWGPTHLREAEQALARKAVDPTFHLIPVVLPGIRPNDMSALGDGSLFREINWADLRGGLDDQDGFDKLYSALTGQVLPEGRGPARLTPYQVRRDAQRWQKSRQLDTSILYRGSQLKEAEKIAREVPDITTATEIAPFLLASAGRQRKVSSRITLVAISIAVVVTALAFLADSMRRLAEDRRAIAVSQRLALESKAETAPSTALLLAAQAYAEAHTNEATGNLLEQIQVRPQLDRLLHGQVGPLTKVVWSGKSASLIAGSGNGGLVEWSDAIQSRHKVLSRASKGAIRSAALGNDGSAIWVGYEDGRVIVWDRNGSRLPIVGIPQNIDIQHIAEMNELKLGPSVESIAVSLNGNVAAIGTADGTGDGMIFLVDQKTKSPLGLPISVDVPRVNALDFDRSSNLLVAGTGYGTIMLIDSYQRTKTKLTGLEMDEIVSVQFTADRSIVAVDAVGHIGIWRPHGQTFKLARDFWTTDGLTAASVSQNGEVLALGDGWGKIHIYSVSSGKKVSSLRAHVGMIHGLAWDIAGSRLASAGADGSAGVWSFKGLSPLISPRGKLAPRVLLLQDIPGLGLFAARSSLGSAGLFSWSDGEWVPKQNILDATKGILGQHRFSSIDSNFRSNNQMVDIPSPEIEHIEMDRRGIRIAWATRDGAVLWSPRDDTSTPHLLWDETKQEGRTIDALRLSNSGRYLGVAFDNKRVLVFDLANHETIETSTYIKIPISDRVRSLNFNNSEVLLGTGMENGGLALWSIPNAIKIAEAKGIHSSPTGNVTFSSDGSHLYSHAVVGDGHETAITEVPIPALEPARPLVARASGQPPTRMLVEDKMLVAGDNDGNISLWDLDTRRPIGILRASEVSISAITVDSNQQQVVAADELGNIQAWQISGAGLQTIACRMTNRVLTKEEWNQFLPGEQYSPACGEYQQN